MSNAAFQSISTGAGGLSLKEITNFNPSTLHSLQFSVTFASTAAGNYSTGFTLPAGSMVLRAVMQAKASAQITLNTPIITFGTSAADTGAISTTIMSSSGTTANTGYITTTSTDAIPVTEPYVRMNLNSPVTSGKINVNIIYSFA
jgi:hypothetical protein